MSKSDLSENTTDLLVKLGKAVSSAFPFVGGALAEGFGMIPGQRIDRLVKAVESIQEELNKKMDEEDIINLFKEIEFSNFTIDCINSLTNEIYDEKIVYYKNLFIESCTSGNEEIFNNERILQILKKVSFKDIQYLKYYYAEKIDDGNIKNDALQKLSFTSILPSKLDANCKDCTSFDVYKEITLNNLISLYLISNNIMSGVNDKKYKCEITAIGELILSKIGEI